MRRDANAAAVLARARGWLSWVLGWIPLSGLGFFCLLLVGPAMHYLALGSKDMVLLALGSGYLVLQALFSTLVWVRALVLTGQISRTQVPMPHGAEAERPYWLPPPARLWNWIPFVQVTWHWLEPGASVQLVRRQGKLQEEVTLQRRGVYQRILREFVVSDLLGLARVRFRRTALGEFQVIPAVGRLHQTPLLVRWSSGDEVSDPRGDPAGDRVDMRQYTKGDSPRTILWKVFARTRRLMVRVPERALAPRPKVCAYMVTGPRDEAAAAVCRVLLEADLLGPDWRFGCDGAPGHDHQKQPAMDRLCRSAESRKPQPDQMGTFLQKAQSDGYSQGIIVLPLDLAGLDQAVRDSLWRSPVPLQLCLAIDGQPDGRGSRWRGWWRRPQPAEQLSLQLQRAAQLWRGFPGQIMLVDRRNGTLLGDLQAYLRRSA